ncbi:MAG: glucan biosynthesis glucosyltransferase H, partial [Alphaproteobacteria bacterium]
MDGLITPFQGMPPESPLPMAAQSFRQKPGRTPRPPSSPRSIAWRRLLVVGGAVILTVVATREMSLVLGSNGLTALAYLILALFVSLFAWIALALT